MKPTVREISDLARQLVEHKQTLMDHWRELRALYMARPSGEDVNCQRYAETKDTGPSIAP